MLQTTPTAIPHQASRHLVKTTLTLSFSLPTDFCIRLIQVLSAAFLLFLLRFVDFAIIYFNHNFQKGRERLESLLDKKRQFSTLLPTASISLIVSTYFVYSKLQHLKVYSVP